MTERWRCDECYHIALNSEWLEARSPFDPDDHLSGCPACKATNAAERLCDEPGCKQLATCGTPFPGGYKMHCHVHPPGER